MAGDKNSLVSAVALFVLVLFVLMAAGCGEQEPIAAVEEKDEITIGEIEEYLPDGGAASPDAVVRNYMRAMGDDNAEAYMSCFQPSYLLNMLEKSENIPKPRDMESFVRSMHIALMMLDQSFVDVDLEVAYVSDAGATVTVSGGRWMWGEEVFWDFAEDAVDFEVVMEEERWYLKGGQNMAEVTL
jgi:hypothetical protein